MVDAKFATAPFVHTSKEMGIPAIARLKANLPALSAAVEARFSNQPPTMTFEYGDDWIEAWDAGDFDPWEALEWPTVQVLRYRQHKKDGTVIKADWLTNIPIARRGTMPLFKRAKSRWEIENQMHFKLLRQMRFKLLRQGVQRRQEPLRHGAHPTSPPQ